ncbi:hypothetical protein GJ496_002626 [Pomphorhynchus laevis]|nr:hypothetical protein GJ496_002626 [Pomphorhynchus laevis]
MLTALVIKTRRVVIISAYAPQQACSDEEKDDFWQRLSDATQSVKEDEIVFVGTSFVPTKPRWPKYRNSK